MKILLGALLATLTITAAAQYDKSQIDSMKAFSEEYMNLDAMAAFEKVVHYGAGPVYRFEYVNYKTPPQYEVVTITENKWGSMARFALDAATDSLLYATHMGNGNMYEFVVRPDRHLFFQEILAKAKAMKAGDVRDWKLYPEDFEADVWRYDFWIDDGGEGLTRLTLDPATGELLDSATVADPLEETKRKFLAFAPAATIDSALAFAPGEIQAVEQTGVGDEAIYDFTIEPRKGAGVIVSLTADGTLVRAKHGYGATSYWLNKYRHCFPYYQARFIAMKQSPDVALGWRFERNSEGKWRYFFDLVNHQGLVVYELVGTTGRFVRQYVR
jgi:uncharacterized membrane protein YkoI